MTTKKPNGPPVTYWSNNGYYVDRRLVGSIRRNLVGDGWTARALSLLKCFDTEAEARKYVEGKTRAPTRTPADQGDLF